MTLLLESSLGAYFLVELLKRIIRWVNQPALATLLLAWALSALLVWALGAPLVPVSRFVALSTAAGALATVVHRTGRLLEAAGDHFRTTVIGALNRGRR